MRHLDIQLSNLITGRKYDPTITEGDGSIDMKGWNGIATGPTQNILLSGNNVQKMNIEMQDFTGNLLFVQSDNQPNNGTTFVDDSSYARAITSNGEIHHSTALAIPIGGNTSSIAMDGVDDWLATADSDSWNLDDFTIDLWAHKTSWNDYAEGLISQMRHDGSYWVGWAFLLRGSNLVFDMGDQEGGTILDAAAGFSLNQWNHVALVRSSNTLMIFLNGILIDQTTYAPQLNSAQQLNIGMYGPNDNAPTYNYEFIGNMDKIRIINEARWTSNFDPNAIVY